MQKLTINITGEKHKDLLEAVLEVAKELNKGYTAAHGDHYTYFVSSTDTQLKRFYAYVLDFYGANGIYPMGATLDQVMEATAKYLMRDDTEFSGDSVDRENVRDILVRDYGLVTV